MSFHFEYFKLDDGSIVALEVNIRPPRGPTLDMFNYANDIDIYRQYGKLIAQAEMDIQLNRNYNCFYIGRRNSCNYIHSYEDIVSSYGDYLLFHEATPPILAPEMGDYGLILRTEEIEKGKEAVEYILDKD